MAVIQGVAAQEPVRIVRAAFEPESLLLGDHFELVVEVEAESDSYEVALPLLDDGLAEGRIELVEDVAAERTTPNAEGYRLRKSYRLRSFEPATYGFDSLAVAYTDGTKIDTLFWNGRLTVEVQDMPIDTARQTIYDIKQPLDAPLLVDEFRGYLWGLVLLGAVVASLVWLAVRALRRSRGTQEAVELPKEAPHIVAIRSLLVLDSQKLWQNGRYKEYYTRLMDILRSYLDGRFGVGAMEMTTDQIVEAFKQLPLSDKQRRELGTLLGESDLVKFAKHIPSAETNEAAYYTVYYFVEESKEVAEQVVSEGEQSVEGIIVKEKMEEDKQDADQNEK